MLKTTMRKKAKVCKDSLSERKSDFFLQRTIVQWVTRYVTILNGEKNGAKIKAMLLALNVMLLAVEVMLLHPKSNASAERRG